ncbi:MAG: hypothetical protein V1927_03825 [Candidatus Omnitrophota bacterium]
MRPVLNKLIFFIGWLLSPFTFWNDAFINIPISYLCANLFIRLFPSDFLLTVLIFYWMSNLIGIFMMYVCGKNILKGGENLILELAKLLCAITLYSLMLLILGRMGILKPLP